MLIRFVTLLSITITSISQCIIAQTNIDGSRNDLSQVIIENSQIQIRLFVVKLFKLMKLF